MRFVTCAGARQLSRTNGRAHCLFGNICRLEHRDSSHVGGCRDAESGKTGTTATRCSGGAETVSREKGYGSFAQSLRLKQLRKARQQVRRNMMLGRPHRLLSRTPRVTRSRPPQCGLRRDEHDGGRWVEKRINSFARESRRVARAIVAADAIVGGETRASESRRSGRRMTLEVATYSAIAKGQMRDAKDQIAAGERRRLARRVTGRTSAEAEMRNADGQAAAGANTCSVDSRKPAFTDE
jgi:hypothetical protein